MLPHACLLTAKIDRLARNTAFLMGLIDSSVDACCLAKRPPSGRLCPTIDVTAPNHAAGKLLVMTIPIETAWVGIDSGGSHPGRRNSASGWC
jgi:hypothetical protein